MTAQVPETLKNDYPHLRFGAWAFRAAIRGTPSEANDGWGDRKKVYRASPGEVRPCTSANWKGFRGRWQLTTEGRLVLLKFSYDEGGRADQPVNEMIEGDFYMVFVSRDIPFLLAPRLYVPFRDGVLVTNREHWLHEDFIGDSVHTELRSGCHPAFPGPARIPDY